jgi:hypothetical protein
MPVLLECLQEVGDESPAFKTRELQEVPPQEHAGTECNELKKPGFQLRVAMGF